MTCITHDFLSDKYLVVHIIRYQMTPRERISHDMDSYMSWTAQGGQDILQVRYEITGLMSTLTPFRCTGGSSCPFLADTASRCYGLGPTILVPSPWTRGPNPLCATRWAAKLACIWTLATPIRTWPRLPGSPYCLPSPSLHAVGSTLVSTFQSRWVCSDKKPQALGSPPEPKSNVI
jgi:hypothetical protein